MTDTEIKKMLEKLHQSSIRMQYSEYALEAVKNAITQYHITEKDDIYKYAIQEADNTFIYNSQAFNYIIDQNITDFTDAINAGVKPNIAAIATWCLIDEVYGLLYELDIF